VTFLTLRRTCDIMCVGCGYCAQGYEVVLWCKQRIRCSCGGVEVLSHFGCGWSRRMALGLHHSPHSTIDVVPAHGS
jgi:hypothetical protein